MDEHNSEQSVNSVKLGRRTEDLTGRIFERITVLRLDSYHLNKDGKGRPSWLCKCQCGKEIVVRARNLKNGSVRSCRCLQRELASEKQRGLPYQTIFKAAIRTASYRNLRFEISFSEFVENFVGKSCEYCGIELHWRAHRSSKKDSKGYNLDRKDNSIGYTKENCCACCAQCNYLKRDYLTYEAMLAVGKIIRALGGWNAIRSGNQNLDGLETLFNPQPRGNAV